MTPPLFPEWTMVIGAMIGAFFGSFLNMVIYRLPRHLSFSDPKRSFCPNCKHSLEWIDLFPLLSWASTGGKCRYCKDPIAFRYEMVEIITAVLFAGVWWRFMSGVPNPDLISAVAYALCTCALVAIIFIDWATYTIPDELNAFLLVVAVVYQAIEGRLMFAFEGALLGWGLLWGIAFLGRLLFGKDAMGDGDIKMMRGIGALLGPLLLAANVSIAVVLGIIGGVAGLIVASVAAKKAPEATAPEEEPYEPTPIWLVAASGAWYFCCLDVVQLFVKPLDTWVRSKFPEEEEEDDWKPSITTIPFGPYLAAGTLVCMLFGPWLQSQILGYWHERTEQGAALSLQTPMPNNFKLGSTILPKPSSHVEPPGVEPLQVEIKGDGSGTAVAAGSSRFVKKLIC
jgi:leader peptidase (prepilin peptidase)/N-methyltransferase